MKSEIHFCGDLGLFTLDRPRSTCRHKTWFCEKYCYNNKFEWLYKLEEKDRRNEEYWKAMDGKEINDFLSRARIRPTKRFRFMSRGEAFSVLSDIHKVEDVLKNNRGTLFQIPTRSWRKPAYRSILESIRHKHRNLRLQASIDPSSTVEEVRDLWNSGWSLMLFGFDSKEEAESHFGIEFTNCPKTHRHIKGHCKTCRGRCFSKKQTAVFLEQHT